MLLCFPDTNVLLHFKPFDEVNWLEFLKTDSVWLVITLQVIKELDSYKYRTDKPKIQERAKRIISKLHNFQTSEQEFIRENIALRLNTSVPNSEWLKKHSYDYESGDELIIATVDYHKSLYPNDEVVLVSNDMNFQLMAKSRGVPCKIPPIDWLLPSETDPKDEKIRELQRELAQYKSAKPRLEIGFETANAQKSSILTLQIKADSELIDQDEEINREIQREFNELRYTDRIRGQEHSENSFRSNMGSTQSLLDIITTEYPTQQEVDSYHEEVKKYLNIDYRQYVIEKIAYRERWRYVHPIQVILENQGSVPGENIDVLIFIPEKVKVVEHLHPNPSKPLAPLKPKSVKRNILDPLIGIQSPDLSYLHLLSSIDSHQEDFKPRKPSFSISKLNELNEYKIEWGPLDILKHGSSYKIQKFYILLDPQIINMGFEIRYQITANNLINVVEGKLALRIEPV